MTHFYKKDGGLVVSMVAFYSDDPSLNPAEANSFYVKWCRKRTKTNNLFLRPRIKHNILFKTTCPKTCQVSL